MSYPCPCCEKLTLDEPTHETWDICPVCFWEDDRVQFEDPSFAGGANDVSLLAARKNYSEFGASERKFIDRVRVASPDEEP